tara:strand:- start:4 stop:363 length:360 start_codon:yes stop_codon:yes gene_type:complete
MLNETPSFLILKDFLPNYFKLLREDNALEEKDIKTIFSELQTMLSFLNIKTTICEIYSLKESGVFLYNDGFLKYNFVLCSYNANVNNYKFYHFEKDLSFYSSKSVLENVSKRICLIISV